MYSTKTTSRGGEVFTVDMQGNQMPFFCVTKMPTCGARICQHSFKLGKLFTHLFAPKKHQRCAVGPSTPPATTGTGECVGGVRTSTCRRRRRRGGRCEGGTPGTASSCCGGSPQSAYTAARAAPWGGGGTRRGGGRRSATPEGREGMGRASMLVARSIRKEMEGENAPSLARGTAGVCPLPQTVISHGGRLRSLVRPGGGGTMREGGRALVNQHLQLPSSRWLGSMTLLRGGSASEAKKGGWLDQLGWRTSNVEQWSG